MRLLQRGCSVSEVSRALGVGRSAVRDWRDRRTDGVAPRACFRCNGTDPSDVAAYAALLGYYFGDGCVGHVPAPGVVVVRSWWKHWPCLFPQHGPGRKHERRLVLERWQQDLVHDEPAAFLRGLFHSDGCRVDNWAARPVAGEVKRYDYPRWQFVNCSEDILGFCTDALDAVGCPGAAATTRRSRSRDGRPWRSSTA